MTAIKCECNFKLFIKQRFDITDAAYMLEIGIFNCNLVSYGFFYIKLKSISYVKITGFEINFLLLDKI